MKKIVLSLMLVLLLTSCTPNSSKPEMALESFDQTVLALQEGDDLVIEDECARLFIDEQATYCESLFSDYQDGTRIAEESVIYTNIESIELNVEDKTEYGLDQYSDVFEVTYEYTIADDSTTHTNKTIMVYKEDVYYLFHIIEEN